jgi:hypothetical protein
MAAAPPSATYMTCPSSERASCPGSLPTKVDCPTVPVAGSISLTLLPPAPALLGTLA